MAEYFSTTALPELLTNNLENSTTSIELLRLRQVLVDSSSILELDGTFGDEILNSILVDDSGELSSARQPCVQIL